MKKDKVKIDSTQYKAEILSFKNSRAGRTLNLAEMESYRSSNHSPLDDSKD